MAEKAVDILYNKLGDGEYAAIVHGILCEAEARFKQCGRHEDFCLQNLGPCGSIVFGGVNRVIWSAKNGFKLDEGYCTAGFIKEWRQRWGKYA